MTDQDLTLTGFSEDSLTSSNHSSGAESQKSPRARKWLRAVGWTFLGLLLLILFTFFKLPDEKLGRYVDSLVLNALAPQGLSYTAQKSYLSTFPNFRYTLEDVRLFSFRLGPGSNAQVGQIDRLSVSPSIFSSLFGNYGGSVDLALGSGSLSGKGTLNRGSQLVFSFKSKKFQIGQMGLLPMLAGIQGSAIIDGFGGGTADLTTASNTEGTLNVKLAQLVIEPQVLAGFSIPKITISEGEADLEAKNGKVLIKTVRLGKANDPNEGIRGTLSGELTLGKKWEASQLNLRTQFSISESILKAFFLLDALLGSGKQADGSYAFQLTGNLLSPIPAPLGPGGK